MMLQDTSTTTKTRLHLSVRNVAVALTVFAVAAGIVLGVFVFPVKKRPPSPQLQTLTGVMDVLHTEGIGNQVEDDHYVLRINSGRWLTLSGNTEPLRGFLSGQRVQALGTVSGTTMTVQNLVRIGEDPPEEPEGLWGTTGNRRVAVLLVNFQDSQSQPFTVAQARTEFLTGPDSLDAYYRENTYGRTWVTGEAYGWFTLPINRTCDSFAYTTAAIAAADPVIDYRNYDHLIFLTPALNGICTSGGWALLGPSWYDTQDGRVQLTEYGLFSLNDDYGKWHEFGHDLKARHSNELDCGFDVIGPNCVETEETDSYALMGDNAVHHTAAHKRFFRWYEGGQLKTVTESGVYRIEPNSTNTTGIKLLRVPVSRTRPEYFLLEYRQPIGFDDNFQIRNYASNGVLVHLEQRNPGDGMDGETHLLDMTPNSTQYDFSDATLVPGRTFSNDAVTIRPLAIDPSGIDVEVTLASDVCYEAPPTVSVDPAELIVYQGLPDRFFFTISITNNDRPGCAANVFDWSTTPDLASQWSVEATAETLTIAPGETGTVEVTLRPNASTPLGSTDYTVSAWNPHDPLLYQASDSLRVTYAWTTTCEHGYVPAGTACQCYDRPPGITDGYCCGGVWHTEACPASSDPVVRIVSPADGAVVRGAVPYAVLTYDPDGGFMREIHWYVNDFLLLMHSNPGLLETIPWYTYVSSGFWPNGSYRLVATAVDDEGVMVTSATTNVTVRNPAIRSLFSDDFNDGNANGWFGTGVWGVSSSQESSPYLRKLSGTGMDDFRWVGNANWSAHGGTLVVKARVKHTSTADRIGITGYTTQFTPGLSYELFYDRSSGKLTLAEALDTVAEIPYTMATNAWYVFQLSFTEDGSNLKVNAKAWKEADHEYSAAVIDEYVDPTPKNPGSAGVYCSLAAQCRFDDFKVFRETWPTGGQSPVFLKEQAPVEAGTMD